MAGGYFNDGALNVELGAHAFATPGSQRRNLLLDTTAGAGHSASGKARVLDSGGGVLSLSVTGQRNRANLGDCEKYIYEVFAALATSGAGTLGCEDIRGHQSTFGNSVCVSASGEVRGFRFADMTFDFETPEKSVEPAWGAIPATPATYGGTSWLQDYQAGGQGLGVGGQMKIEMIRRRAVREIPRSRGGRTTPPYSGAVMRFAVEAAAVADVANLATYVEDLIRLIGPGPVDLTANGNTYADVVLGAAKPSHTDRKHTSVTFEFIQQL